MKSKKKMLLILGLAAVLLLGTAAVLLGTDESSSPENQTETSAEGQMEELVGLTAEQIDTIEITNDTGNYIISRTDAGLMTVDAVQSYALNQALLQSALGILDSFSGEVIFEEAYDEEKYGLDEPAAQLKITSGDTEKTVYLGNYNEGASAWYVKTDEADKLYSIASGIGDWFLYSPFKYVDTELIRSFNSSTDELLDRLTRVKIERPDLEEPLEIVADEGEAAAYTSSYVIISPVEVRTSYQTMNSQIGGLFGLRADETVGVYKEADAAAYGMDAPAMTMTVDHDGITEVFTVGAEAEDGVRYLITSENDLLYTISELKLAFLHVTADDLFFEMALLPNISTVEQVTLEFAEERYTFDLEHGAEAKDLTVQMDERELDANLFRKYYSFLLEIDIEKLNTEEIGTERVMAVTFQYADGTEDLVEAYATEEARRMSIYVNGNASFEGRLAYVEKAKTELEHLLNGQDIDTNW